MAEARRTNAHSFTETTVQRTTVPPESATPRGLGLFKFIIELVFGFHLNLISGALELDRSERVIWKGGDPFDYVWICVGHVLFQQLIVRMQLRYFIEQGKSQIYAPPYPASAAASPLKRE